jgi:hypothetical protein
MMNVCHNCGEYRADKEIDPAGPYAICPLCGFEHRFRQLPLPLIGGASGVGKTTVYNRLVGTLDGAVLLEADVLWRSEFDQPEDNYRAFFEPCVERRYFSAAHYLALTCDDAAIVERLKSRPARRMCGDPGYIEAHVAFNRWFKEKASSVEPPAELLDTTGLSIELTII